jgi:hypothetical protein
MRARRGVTRLADRRVDVPPEIAQPLGGRAADAGRRAGYEDRRDFATCARCSRP